MTNAITKEDIEFLRMVVSYDPVSGVFTWKRVQNSYGGRSYVGGPAGTVKDGYVTIGIMGRYYRAHRLAWTFMTGDDIPRGLEIDHVNRNRSDNRWENLRLVDRTRNNHNSAPHRNNTSGVKGVSWASSKGRWDARIKIKGKLTLLGTFTEFSDAVAARVNAEMALLNESPSTVTGLPNGPKVEKIKAARWIDENRDEFRASRSLKVRKTNTSGCPGVRLHKASGLWHARIVIRRRELSLGYFKIRDDAIAARVAAEREHFGVTHLDI